MSQRLDNAEVGAVDEQKHSTLYSVPENGKSFKSQNFAQTSFVKPVLSLNESPLKVRSEGVSDQHPRSM